MSLIGNDGGGSSSSSRGLGHWITSTNADGSAKPHPKAKLGSPVAKDNTHQVSTPNPRTQALRAKRRDSFEA